MSSIPQNIPEMSVTLLKGRATMKRSELYQKLKESHLPSVFTSSTIEYLNIGRAVSGACIGAGIMMALIYTCTLGLASHGFQNITSRISFVMKVNFTIAGIAIMGGSAALVFFEMLKRKKMNQELDLEGVRTELTEIRAAVAKKIEVRIIRNEALKNELDTGKIDLEGLERLERAIQV